MDPDLRFLAELIDQQGNQLVNRLSASDGRGSSLATALMQVCLAAKAQAESARASGDLSGRGLAVRKRELHRSRQQLDVAYQVVSLWSNDMGRQDLPVGLLFLIDDLIRDLLPNGADPIVHLEDEFMYSTIAVLEALPDLLKPGSVPAPHPVVFNVPRLDPSNALLSPLLAHEVGHTAWRQGIDQLLHDRVDHDAVQGHLDAAVAAGEMASDMVNMFEDWQQELMCDVLAATLTGPSFLFASAVFLPAPADGDLGTHPYPRDRIGLALRVLERYGWIPILESAVPEVLDWCRDLAARPQLTGGHAETALRAAMREIEEPMISVAAAQCVRRLDATSYQSCVKAMHENMSLEIPPVQVGTGASGAWMIAAAAWLYEINQLDPSDRVASLPRIARDARLNRFVTKSIELAAIDSLWSEHEPPAS